MPSEETIAECRTWRLVWIDLWCRSGFYDLPFVLDSLVDGVVNELDIELEDPAARALVMELTEAAMVAFERRAAEEATWNERTTTDRIDDALRELSDQGLVVGKATYASLGGSGAVERLDDESDPWTLLSDARWDLGLTLRFEDSVRATGQVDARRSTSRPDADLAKEGDEIVRVFGQHGVSARYDPKTRAVQLGQFVFQKRRSTKEAVG